MATRFSLFDRILLVALFVAVPAVAWIGLQRYRDGSVRSVVHQPVRVSYSLESGGFFARQVFTALTEADAIAARVPEPATRTATVSEASRPIPMSELRRRAGDYVYVEYGAVGPKRVATFLHLETNLRITKAEGGTIADLRIAEVTEDFALLFLNDEGPLKKPRIDLAEELPRIPESEMTPEEREERWERYRELYGNRAETARLREAQERGGASPLPPGSQGRAERDAEAKRRYLEEFPTFMERVREGDPNVDPSDNPLYLKAEEAIRESALRRQEAANPGP